MSETWLSQEAYDRLQEELEQLRTEGREQMAKDIETARAHGDLSENAEYDAAKEAQGKMEARIRQLEALLRDAKIGVPEDTDEVRPGLVVTLDFGDDAETFLVGSREDSHDTYEVLSSDSPIGKAVIGQESGETVTVEAPRGSYPVTITEIAMP